MITYSLISKDDACSGKTLPYVGHVSVSLAEYKAPGAFAAEVGDTTFHCVRQAPRKSWQCFGTSAVCVPGADITDR